MKERSKKITYITIGIMAIITAIVLTIGIFINWKASNYPTKNDTLNIESNVKSTNNVPNNNVTQGYITLGNDNTTYLPLFTAYVSQTYINMSIQPLVAITNNNEEYTYTDNFAILVNYFAINPTNANAVENGYFYIKGGIDFFKKGYIDGNTENVIYSIPTGVFNTYFKNNYSRLTWSVGNNTVNSINEYLIGNGFQYKNISTGTYNINFYQTQDSEFKEQFENFPNLATANSIQISNDNYSIWNIIIGGGNPEVQYLKLGGNIIRYNTSTISYPNPYKMDTISYLLIINDNNTIYYQKGYESGKTLGYNEGYDYAMTNNRSIWTLVANIGQVPLNIIQDTLNFEILGINMSNFVMAILTAALVTIILKVFI